MTHEKQTIVDHVRQLGHFASAYYLRQLGWTEAQIERAVRAGQLRWTRDGFLSAK